MLGYLQDMNAYNSLKETQAYFRLASLWHDRLEDRPALSAPG